MLQIEIIYHYPDYDINCDGEFYASDLTVDGIVILSYSDQYHNNPREKFEGFLKGLTYCGKPYILKTININDCIDY